MKIFIILTMTLFWPVHQDPKPANPENFRALEIYVETGDRLLAAYQFELEFEKGRGTIVGVEGGEAGPFADAPYYDLKALKGSRIIVAAFTTSTAPPSGRIRVARLHVFASRDASYRVKLMTAATPGGARFEGGIEVKPYEENK
jgi:hypothetical protein